MATLDDLTYTNSFFMVELTFDFSGCLFVRRPRLVFVTKQSQKTAVNDLTFKTVSNIKHPIIIPKYDLNGIEANGISIDWDPYYTMEECDSNVRLYFY